MIVVVNGHCCSVVVTQHSFGGDSVIQGGSANLRVTNHSRVTEVDVEILILFKNVIINHPDCDLWLKKKLYVTSGCHFKCSIFKMCHSLGRNYIFVEASGKKSAPGAADDLSGLSLSLNDMFFKNMSCIIVVSVGFTFEGLSWLKQQSSLCKLII